MKFTKKKTIIALLVVVILFAAYHQFAAPSDLDDFAQCLTEKGIKIYGAYWCHNCNDQKDMFGTSVKYLDYIECTEETEVCDKEDIQYYPTWRFPNSPDLIGKQTLETLSRSSGCKL